MIFEKYYEVGLRDIGANNDATNIAILGYLEDIASLHSDTVGLGPDDVFDKKIVWLLSDWKLEVIKRPHYKDKLKVMTWAKGKELCSSYRDFKILNENNEIIVKATSKWIYFDLNKNKISKIDDNILELYNPEIGISVFEEGKLEKIKQPNDFEKCIEYTVKRLDIDINNHMHNLNYLNLAYEALPEDIYNNQELNNVRISYKKEIKLNDKIKCLYSFENDKHIVAIKSFDDKIIHAIIELS